jgi:3-hydroxyisobutyrate dehydrogenase-like beta-hydroxyacid dehydrogenase
MERKQIRLGLVGFGEVGSTLGQGFREEGLIEIAAYDKYAFDGPFRDLIQSRAAKAGVPLVRSPQELAERSQTILSVTPGAASIESAEAFAPHVTAEHILVDLASATPKVKQAAGRALRASGVDSRMPPSWARRIRTCIACRSWQAARRRDGFATSCRRGA